MKGFLKLLAASFILLIFSFSTLPAQTSDNETIPLWGGSELDYEAFGIVLFVENCMKAYYQQSNDNPGNEQRRVLIMKMCSCVMDHYRNDYTVSQLNKQYQQIMPLMSPRYAAMCAASNGEKNKIM